MIRFNERVYYKEHDDRTDQPYVYYIRGDKLSVLVDAGNSPHSVEELYQEIREAGLKEPDLCVLTHWHWDHTFGIPAVKCPVIASAKTNEKLREVSNWQWTEEAMLERLKSGEDIEFCYQRMHEEYGDIRTIKTGTAQVEFRDHLKIDCGGITILLEQRDSPHTRDAVFVLIPELKLLFGGDAEYEDYYDNDSKYDPVRLEAMIRYLQESDFEVYFRGHDDAAVSKKDILMKLKDALVMI